MITKTAAPILKQMATASKYGLDPLSVGMSAYNVGSGNENIPGVVGGLGGSAGAMAVSSRLKNSVTNSNWAKSLLGRVGGKYGKALVIGGKLLGGVASIGSNLAGYSLGAKAGRSLGKTPRAFAVPPAGRTSQAYPAHQVHTPGGSPGVPHAPSPGVAQMFYRN